LQLLEKMIADANGKELSAGDAFKLSDTYGFPIDLTKEILAENGMSVDLEGCKALAAAQRERSRAARKEAGGWDSEARLDTKGLPATTFLGYETDEAEAKILAIFVDGESVDSADDEAVIVLDKTPFYAEGGGQCGDTGWLHSSTQITATTKTHDGIVLHHGTAANLSVGDTVRAKVHRNNRTQIRANHTAAHLLQAALRKVLGSHVEQAGQSVTAHSVRFDFTHFQALTREALSRVETLVNEAIWQAIPVETEVLSLEEAKARGAMALFGEKYGGMVRMVRVGDVSLELCGGTHARNTGNLGAFFITSEGGVSSGVRRIEAVTQAGAVAFYHKKQENMQRTANALKANSEADLLERAFSVANQLRDSEKALAAARKKLSGYAVQTLLQSMETIGGVRFVAGVLEGADALRGACDIAKASGDDVVALFAAVSEKGGLQFAASAAPGAVAAGAHAGNIVKAAAAACGGKGGGKPESAMAGGREANKLEAALLAGKAALQAML
jgi:alanyl-tRNA synthetase